MSLRAVLFDLDGTLIATRELYLESYRRALARHLGRALSDDEIIAARPVSERRFLESQLADPALFDSCVNDFCAIYRELHATLFGGAYAGVVEMLAALRRTATPLGVVSGKSRRAWEITSATAGLGRFDVVVLEDDVHAPKPDPQGLLLALDALGVDAQHAIYVGDTMGDMHAALAAGMTPGAALWSQDPARRARLDEGVQSLGGVAFQHPHEVAALLSCSS